MAKTQKKDGFFKNNRAAPENRGPQKDNFFKKKSEKSKPPQNKTRNEQQTAPSTSVSSESKASSSKTEKKSFDKKLWRLKKYSNKYKLQQWEDARKKTVLREYYKDTRNEKKIDVAAIYEKDEDMENDNNVNEDLSNEEVAISNTQKKSKAFKKAHLEFERLQDEKKKKKEEFLKAKAEKEEALKNYKKDKLEKYKKLNRKTKRGQPVMKYRMEMLLDKIQKSVNTNK